ncbi:hypothetical protein BZA77DRAFT_356573 [Pyronema omphalodes]|nr:hypothetical protein BZA77DRAFT_356573 [Pyronema omphalodes]
MYFDPSPPQSPMSGTHRSRRDSTSTKSSKSKHTSSTSCSKSQHSSRSCSHSSRSSIPDLISQALQNTLFLHPASSPSIITSRDKSGNSRTIIISSAGRILFQQPGTSAESYAELLAATERGVHDRLVNLDSPSSSPAKPAEAAAQQPTQPSQPPVDETISTLRTSISLARLQRENSQLLTQLSSQRLQGLQLHLPNKPKPQPAVEYRANIGGLPKSRAQLSRGRKSTTPVPATSPFPVTKTQKTQKIPKTPGSMLGARRWGEYEDVKAWLKALGDEDVVGDEFESVSSAAELAAERRRSLAAAAEATEEGKKELMVQVKEITVHDITPPITPPPMVGTSTGNIGNTNQLPRSRAFRGRA